MSREISSVLWSVDQSLNATAKAKAQNNMGVGDTLITGAPSDKYVSWTHRDTNGNIHVNQESIQSTFVTDSGLADSHRPINALGVLDAMRNTFTFSKAVVVEVDNQGAQVGADQLIASPCGHDIKVAWDNVDYTMDIVIKDEVPTIASSEIFSVCNMIRYATGGIQIYNYDTRYDPAAHNITAYIPMLAFSNTEHERYDITLTFGISQDSLWLRVIPVKLVENVSQYRLVISGQYMPGPVQTPVQA